MHLFRLQHVEPSSQMNTQPADVTAVSSLWATFFRVREIQHNSCHIMSFNISSFCDEGSHNQQSEKKATTDVPS